MRDKRGQEVSPLPVVIGIILLLGVAVVLILGFTKGWQVFSFWIPQNNIQTLASQCNIACQTQNKYDFCSLSRTLSDPSSKDTLMDTTKNPPVKVLDTNGQAMGSCNHFANDEPFKTKYGLPNCPAITC